MVHTKEWKRAASDRMKELWKGDEHRNKVSISMKEKWKDEDFRRKMMKRVFVKGWNPGDDVRKNMSVAAKKRWSRESERGRQSERVKMLWNDEGYRGSTKVGLKKGYKHTDEAKRNMSVAQLGHVVSDKSRKKMSRSHIGKKYSEKYKRNMSLVKAKECVNGVGRNKNISYNGICFRSIAEKKVAKFLDEQNFDWEYEPEYFEVENGRHYIPDFKIKEKKTFYVEVKNRFHKRDWGKMNYFVHELEKILFVIDHSKMKLKVWE